MPLDSLPSRIVSIARSCCADLRRHSWWLVPLAIVDLTLGAWYVSARPLMPSVAELTQTVLRDSLRESTHPSLLDQITAEFGQQGILPLPDQRQVIIDEDNRFETWQYRLGRYTVMGTRDLRFNDYTDGYHGARLEVYDGDQIVYTAKGYKFTIADEASGYAQGKAITAKGYPSMIVHHWTGGANCCYSFHILELGPEFRVLDVIKGMRGDIRFEDRDGDAVPEISLADFSMAYAFTAGAGTPTPEVILRYQDGEGYRVAADLMQAKPLPTTEELQEKADTIWNECIEEQDDGTVVLKSPGDWGYGTTLWETMLGLVYSGHEDLALEFFEMAWPEFAEGKEEALQEFRETVADSPWYQQLAEQLDMGEVVTEPLWSTPEKL